MEPVWVVTEDANEDRAAGLQLDRGVSVGKGARLGWQELGRDLAAQPVARPLNNGC